MIKTIRDLIEHYDIKVEEDVPDVILDYEFEDESEEFAEEYHTEEHDGETVHVFSSTGNVPDFEGEITIETIFDFGNPTNITNVTKINNEYVSSDSKTLYEDGTEAYFH